MTINRIALFIRSAIAGYEPVMVRTVVVAFFALLATFGIGTGALPSWAEGVLVFLSVIIPLAAGWSARAKVSPVEPTAKHEDLLPDNPYDGTETYDDETD